MIDKDVLLEKINHIQNGLQRIHSKVNNNLDVLQDEDTRDIIVFNLQRTIQSTIDLAFHVISSEKYGVPKNLKDAFQILKDKKIIDHELADKLSRMVGFRNIVVHEYENVNLDVLEYILKHRLKDIENFYTIVLQHYADD